MSNRVPLPIGTALGKSFEYGVDINLGTYGTPQFQSVRRMSAFAPTFPATTTDVQTYDDLGAQNNDVTGRSAVLAFTVQGNRNLTTGRYLPEVEALLAAARAKGEGAVIDSRFYHKPENGTPNPDDAGRVFGTVEVTRQNTGNSEIETFAVTITGKGEFEKIPNPFTGWGATAPVISGVGPQDAGDGDLITISGNGFLGATAITVDGVAVPDYTIVDAGSIIAVMPAGDAGAVPVVVTTPGGASAPFSFVRGA